RESRPSPRQSGSAGRHPGHWDFSIRSQFASDYPQTRWQFGTERGRGISVPASSGAILRAASAETCGLLGSRVAMLLITKLIVLCRLLLKNVDSVRGYPDFKLFKSLLQQLL